MSYLIFFYQKHYKPLIQKYKNVPVFLLTGKKEYGRKSIVHGKLCDQENDDKVGVFPKEQNLGIDGNRLSYSIARLLGLEREFDRSCECKEDLCLMKLESLQSNGTVGWSACNKRVFEERNRTGQYSCLM